MNNGFFVYKYEYDNKIIYIGKTINIDIRIKQHRSDLKFKEFVKQHHIKYEDFIIKYYSLDHKFEMDAVEKLLINSIKPILNVVNKTEIESSVNIEIKSEERVYKFEYNKSTNLIDLNEDKDKQNCEISNDDYNYYAEYYDDLVKFVNWIMALDDDDDRVIVNDYPKDKNGKFIWLKPCVLPYNNYNENENWFGLNFYDLQINFTYEHFEIYKINDSALLKLEVKYLKKLTPVILNIMSIMRDEYKITSNGMNFDLSKYNRISDNEVDDILSSLIIPINHDNEYIINKCIRSFCITYTRYCKNEDDFNGILNGFVSHIGDKKSKRLLGRVLRQLYGRDYIDESYFDDVAEAYKLKQKGW